MTTLPHITDAALRAKATEKSYERGQDYHDRGQVGRATLRGNRLFVNVEGSQWEPYRVGVTFGACDFTASCTCPYDWEGYCKHIVAALLPFTDAGNPAAASAVNTAAPIDDLLAGLDAAALRTLVHRLLDADPTLVDILDEFCNPRDSR